TIATISGFSSGRMTIISTPGIRWFGPCGAMPEGSGRPPRGIGLHAVHVCRRGRRKSVGFGRNLWRGLPDTVAGENPDVGGVMCGGPPRAGGALAPGCDASQPRSRDAAGRAGAPAAPERLLCLRLLAQRRDLADHAADVVVGEADAAGAVQHEVGGEAGRVE